MSFKGIQAWWADRISSGRPSDFSKEEFARGLEAKGIRVRFDSSPGGLVMPGPGADRPLPTDSEAGDPPELLDLAEKLRR